VSDISLDKKVYDLIKSGLDASSLRSKVSANNIANINTKGFKASYVSFEDTLKKSVDSLGLATTDERHFKIGSEEGQVSVKKDTTSSMREDGNNVNIDSEMTNQAANALMYNALIAQINNRLTDTRTVINGGR
jgi:flagellar basal-body rod protein FlgB